MAVDPLDIEVNDVELNPMPEYVNKDRKEREAFLSQVGNFSTEERGLFHLLCDNWEHEIGYAKFVTKINKKHPIDEKHLGSLMKKLRASACGILLTRYVRGERGVDKIILTDVQSHFFYYYFLNNEYQKNFEEVSNDFVDESNFEKYEINTSTLDPLNLNINLLNKNFIKNEVNKTNVYQVKLEGYKNFYSTSETLQDLLKIAVRKVKYYFKSDNFIAFIAKIMNSSISKVRTSIDHFEISSWKNLSSEILKNKKLINGKFKNISISFFKAVTIVSNYCNSELEQRDKELEDDKKIKIILKDISDKIREKEFTPFSQETFNSLFDEFKGDAPEIKSKFYELYVDNKTKTGLTDIVFIGQFYIHQDNLYKVFLDQISLATAELHEYFASEYKKCLLSNSSDASLLSGFPFESSIMSKLQAEYPILYDLLNRKGIFAESIIHFCKKRGHSQGKMHNMLAMYFIEGSSELRRVTKIFNLDVTELFEKAYETLPVIKRFFIFVLGQYPKYLERFTGYRKVKKKDQPQKSSKTTARSSGYKNSSNRSSYSSNSGHPSSRKSLIKKDKPVSKKNNMYNQEQRDSAWDNLGSQLTKKKK